jgi:tRNA(Met) C34 N-acetyltransferase TmcA
VFGDDIPCFGERDIHFLVRTDASSEILFEGRISPSTIESLSDFTKDGENSIPKPIVHHENKTCVD